MAVMLFTGTKSLQFLSVPVFTIFKNLTIIIVAYAETNVFGGHVTRLMLASFLLMVHYILVFLILYIMQHKFIIYQLRYLIVSDLILPIYAVFLVTLWYLWSLFFFVFYFGSWYSLIFSILFVDLPDGLGSVQRHCWSIRYRIIKIRCWESRIACWIPLDELELLIVRRLRRFHALYHPKIRTWRHTIPWFWYRFLQ